MTERIGGTWEDNPNLTEAECWRRRALTAEEALRKKNGRLTVLDNNELDLITQVEDLKAELWALQIKPTPSGRVAACAKS